MSTKLTTVIQVSNLADTQQQLQKLNPNIDTVELRVDYMPQLDLTAIKQLLEQLSIPCILTLRSVAHGGEYNGTKEEMQQLLLQLGALQPTYFDIENDIPDAFITEFHSKYPTIQIIRSIHNFVDTPDDLDAILQSMQHKDVSVYKIICFANSSIDALRMMHWLRKNSQQCNLSAHCMGEHGEISRISGPVLSSYFLFAANDTNSAVVAKQTTVQDLIDIYHIKAKNFDTKLYALIGDPVCHSLGHKFHNNYFNEHKINGLYIKIQLLAQELEQFVFYVHALPFIGISVTMPLKQSVLPFVINEYNVDAVNTLKVDAKKITAINTDGAGALAAVTKTIAIADKDILVLGAGGSATAIVAAAVAQGANVTVANRSIHKLTQLQERYQVTPSNFTELAHKSFAIIINTIPNAAYHTKELQELLSHLCNSSSKLLNINYNQSDNIPFEIATKNSCEYIDGANMFTNQALLQQEYWRHKD